MKPIWQKIIVAVVVVLLAWFLTFFRFNSFTGTEGQQLEDRQQAKMREIQDRIIKKIDENDERLIKKIDENDARIVKAIDALRKELKEHKHR